MNLLDFKKTTSYFTKKRPIVFLLMLFSLVCMVVSVQSGAVFIHSFLSAYLPDVSWSICYVVAASVDCVLFYLCAQMFSDVFCGIDGWRRYLDLPTSLLFVAFLSLSLFMSIKGADVRKNHHAHQLAKDGTTKQAVHQIIASIDTSKTVIHKGITRDHRKALEEKTAQGAQNSEAQKNLITAMQMHQDQTEKAQKEFGELLDFSKSVVVIFQLLLILCCGCCEYIKSKKESKSESIKAKAKVAESATNSSKSGKSESNSEQKSKSNSIGFGNSQGHIWKNKIAYLKKDNTLKYYTAAQLSSMATDAERRGKPDQAETFKRLKRQLKNSTIDA